MDSVDDDFIDILDDTEDTWGCRAAALASAGRG